MTIIMILINQMNICDIGVKINEVDVELVDKIEYFAVMIDNSQ